MLKKLLFAVLISMPFIVSAQENTLPPIPMREHIVYYEKFYHIKSALSKQQVISNAIQWFKEAFPGQPAATYNKNEQPAAVNGTGLFKVNTTAGNYYWLRFKVSMIPGDGILTFRVYNVYEKPIEKGITNEFSKIEYRWWDYRNGHPWSADDKPLFNGLDSGVNALSVSLEKKIGKLQAPRFRALALYSTNVEADHVDFAYDAIKFYNKLAAEKGFVMDTTSNWEKLNDDNLKNYQLVIWLNEFPHNEAERRSFEKFMSNGGAWLGFHVSGYNDKDTHWPWFVDFMGGAVFYNNNWPPLPAKMIVDDNKHPVTKNLPKTYTAPINEWYGWKPNPRDNKDVKVLVTLATSNYPLGKKDVIREGDIPVVWTNTKYKMLYMNMGHGDMNMTSALQNKMFEDAILWLDKK
ncbi:MAG TPA: ThuA domain-containing protein [Mucilaginibacter sp.]